jgi:hypothetical protein
MRIQGGTAAALTAVILLAAGACDSSPPKDDDKVSYSSNDVRLSRPELKVAPNGAWRLTATFTWSHCGERPCWALDDRKHGGPDVFGVFLEGGPPVAVQAASLMLQSSCDGGTSLGDARTSETGAYFLVQEVTGEKGSCERFGSEREFNMASGKLEAVVTLVAGAPCPSVFAVTSLFGHSYGDAGREVQVAAGRDPDNPRIDWGDDSEDHFTVLAGENGIYDCTGAPK